MPALRKMAREELVRGLPEIEQVDQLCEACLAGKQKRTPFPEQAKWHAERALELVHGDLCGPVTPATPSGNTYFLLLIDDRSRYMWLVLLPSKDHAAAAIKEFQARAEAESGCKLLALRTDRGGEFTSKEFMKYCAADGVHRQLTAPYFLQQNGVVERRNAMNRVPTKAVEGRTPFEAWYGKKPAVHHLKTFGCIVYVKNTAPHLKNMEDRGRKMIFVGYERGSKAYPAYDPVARRVHVTRDVVFDEGAQWDWSGGDETSTGAVHGGNNTFTVQYRMVPGQEGAEDAAPATPIGGMELGTPPSTHAAAGPAYPLVQFATPPAEVDEELDADHDDEAPLRFHTLENVIGAASPPGYAVRDLGGGQLFARAIGLKWVFKVKKDEHGAVVRHKARLVVKGYAQRHGIDYDEVFAPVARMEAVRLLLALAAQEGWQVHHMDVKTAFLNSDLQEELYVQQAPGFAQPGQEHKVYKLHKALYDLHQAPHAWNQKLDEQLGVFMKCPSEHAIYCRGGGVERLVVGVYVDDLVITGTSSSSIQKFKAEMTKVFKMSDLGLLSYYLGIEVKQDAAGISLSQASYAGKILEKCGLEDCNSCKVPMDVKLKLSKNSSSPRVNATEYRSLVGNLRYLVNTRPDLAFSVGKNGRSDGLLGFSDSDVAGDVDGRKSTSGILFFLGGSPVSWQSTKQKVVALSSCEAEYITAATGACQAVWLARLLAEIRDSAIEVKFISTQEQLGDILTKPLGKVKFQELCTKIGLRTGAVHFFQNYKQILEVTTACRPALPDIIGCVFWSINRRDMQLVTCIPKYVVCLALHAEASKFFLYVQIQSIADEVKMGNKSVVLGSVHTAMVEASVEYLM
ncbi:hypothetical protein U9M48_008813 [Paspalum notatum var. saurae]|uniref:Integrase catalytic domain-containing protein n=1 Tax=Paspalum notatum var. saurae TaxID=547442 RepID=A0AAQ3SR90_PASNO